MQKHNQWGVRGPYLGYDSDVFLQREPEGNLRVAVDQHKMEVILVVRVVFYMNFKRRQNKCHRRFLSVLFLQTEKYNQFNVF